MALHLIMAGPMLQVDKQRRGTDIHGPEKKYGDGSDSVTRAASIEVGHVQGTDEQSFSFWSALAIAHGTTNTAVGIMLVVATTVPFGGTPLIFWGYLAMAVVALCTASSLAELASAIPHAGGQYVWTANLSPPGPRRLLSFAVAILSWLGAVLTSASACLGTVEAVFAIVTLLKPDYEEERWVVFLAYQALNIITLAAACFENGLPKVANIGLAYTILGLVAIFITLFAYSDKHVSAEDFFTLDYNISGWSNGMAFMIGLNGINWGFSCLDAVVHITEEIPRPRINVPNSLMCTVYVSFFSGLIALLAIYVNIPHLSVLDGGGALTAFFYITRGSTAASLALWMVPVVSSTIAVWAIHTWQSRLAWSLARQGGMPFSGHLSRVAPAPFHTPIWALVFSAFWTAVLGCIYIGSSMAFGSLVSAGILFQYISYSVPIFLLLRSGRSKFNHGPFWKARLGAIANCVVLVWTVVGLVIYCFPSYLPLAVDEMNYCSVVIVVFFFLIALLWVAHARKHYNPGNCAEFSI